MRSLLLALLLLASCRTRTEQPPDDLAEICSRLVNAGRLDEAEIACSRAVAQRGPADWDALQNSGLIAQARGDTERAEQFYRRGLGVSPDIRTLNALGLLASKRSDFGPAADFFQAALRIDPSYIEARLNLGTAHLEQGDFSSAVQDFRLLLSSQPRLVEGHLGLAHALMGQNLLEEACSTLQQAATIDAQDERVWLVAGECEQARGRLGIARDAYEACLVANAQNRECAAALRALPR